MSEQPRDDPFRDCKISPHAIHGIRIFEDVLLTGESETPVNVLTGDTLEYSQATIKEA